MFSLQRLRRTVTHAGYDTGGAGFDHWLLLGKDARPFKARAGLQVSVDLQVRELTELEAPGSIDRARMRT